MPYFKSPNVALYYKVFGENHSETIVLVSGLNTQITSWDTEFIASLVLNKFRLIVFDNRDCGKSTVLLNSTTKIKNLSDFFKNPDPLNIEYSLWDMVDDIYNLLQHLDIAKAHIIGRSMGGIIAQLFAYKYPNITKTLSLIMSSSFNPALSKTDDKLIQMMTNENVSYDQNSTLYIKNKLEFLKLIHGKTYSIDIAKEQALIVYNEERKSTNIKPFRQIIALISYVYDATILHQISTPTLIIHGDEDVLFGVESAYDLKKNISNSKLILKQGMGHAIPLELSASIVQDITTFITNFFD